MEPTDSKSEPGKPAMSFSSISFKYNVNQDNIENISVNEPNTNLVDASVIEDTKKNKKGDKSVSLFNKYLKSFKIDKETDTKTDDDVMKDNVERKNVDITNENSGSPIKEYFNKLSKRNDSIDSTSDLDSIKERDSSISTDRWIQKFKFKIAQAVEDIKSSRSSEGAENKEIKQHNDNLSITDSEDNSLQMDLDLNSFASTENQVSSITSSIQNLSELSPPIISHSSTMTDMEIETSSSLETNKILTETADTNFEYHDLKKVKSIQYEDSDIEDDNNLEVESGVDALEDAELVTQNLEVVDISMNNNEQIIEKEPTTTIAIPNENNKKEPLLNSFLIFFTITVFCSINIFPNIVMANGILLGMWSMYCLNKIYDWLLKTIFHNNERTNQLPIYTNIRMSTIPHIVEFEPLKKYEGWMNIYFHGKYDPLTYHISLTQTIFMKLEGSILRLSFTHNKIPKHALFNEQPHKVPFYQHRIYNLEGAKVKLLPKGIVKKRHWSKKYPICVILKDKSKMSVFKANNSIEDNNLPPEDTNSLNDKDDTSSQENTIENIDKLLESNTEEPIINKLSKSTPKATRELNILPSKIENDDRNNIKESSGSPSKNYLKLEPTEEDKLNQNDNDFQLMAEADLLNGSWCKDETSKDEPIILYLFGRTGREKDEWFRRLKSAIKDISNRRNQIKSDGNMFDDEETNSENCEAEDDLMKLLIMEKDNSDSKVQVGNIKSEKKLIGGKESPSVLWTPKGKSSQTPLAESFHKKQEEDFWRYMKDIIEPKPKVDNDLIVPNNILWFNAILGRVIYDTFRNKTWVTMVQERIQKKLTRLKLPSFMGPLVITSLEFGNDAPQFFDVGTPINNVEGLWVDFHVSYNGHITMILTTKLNLMSLIDKKDNIELGDSEILFENPKSETLHAVYHSDLDDTAESSSEDEDIIIQTLPPKINIDSDSATVPPATPGTSSTKKLLKMVDKITTSKYFQHVTEYKYIKRAMEGVSNTDLKLSVEICGLFGCLTINIPPPPSDRLWFGFRGNPQLCLKAKPIVGSRVINFAQITSWIEKKLCAEFEKLLVLPNMEDIQLDCMIAPIIE